MKYKPPIGTDIHGTPLRPVNVMKYYSLTELPEADESRYKRMALISEGGSDELYICIKQEGQYVWTNIFTSVESSEEEDLHDIIEAIDQLRIDLDTIEGDYVTHPELEPIYDELERLDEVKLEEADIAELRDIVSELENILTSEGVIPEPLTDLITRRELYEILGSEFDPDDYVTHPELNDAIEDFLESSEIEARWIEDPEDKEEGQVLVFDGTDWVAEDIDVLPEADVPGNVLTVVQTDTGLAWESMPIEESSELEFEPYLDNTTEIAPRQIVMPGAQLQLGDNVIEEDADYVIVYKSLLLGPAEMYHNLIVSSGTAYLDYEQPNTLTIIFPLQGVHNENIIFKSTVGSHTVSMSLEIDGAAQPFGVRTAFQLFKVNDMGQNVKYGDLYDAISNTQRRLSNEINEIIEERLSSVHLDRQSLFIAGDDTTTTFDVLVENLPYTWGLETAENMYHCLINFYYNGVKCNDDISYEDISVGDVVVSTRIQTLFDSPMSLDDVLEVEVIKIEV